MAIQGKLKFYNHVKGYGFIGREDGQQDIFVHISEFKKSGIKKVVQEMIVEYELDDHNGKPVATEIKIVHVPE
jgi:CspA family cold shock protein|tara:strand:- start:485 stop:703 length:219 start_codon:yes stop_codon:yes gene_type:complete